MARSQEVDELGEGSQNLLGLVRGGASDGLLEVTWAPARWTGGRAVEEGSDFLDSMCVQHVRHANLGLWRLFETGCKYRRKEIVTSLTRKEKDEQSNSSTASMKSHQV